MKKFNKSIKVEVSVDSIASKLLETFKEDNPHRELLTETIIGNLMEESRLSGLYNSLHGWRDEINFEVGQKLFCKDNHYSFKGQEDIDKNDRDSKYIEIGECEVVEINEYARREQIKVKHTTVNRNMKEETKSSWVHISSLTEIDKK